jgi:hypothetical protein
MYWLVTFVAVSVVTQVEQENTMYLREACSSNSRENCRPFISRALRKHHRICCKFSTAEVSSAEVSSAENQPALFRV